MRVTTPPPALSWGKLILVSGRTGAGKDRLSGQLLADYPDRFEKVVTATSRAPRTNNGITELEGLDYHFVKTREEFEAGIREGHYLEHAIFGKTASSPGQYYGTPLYALQKIWAKGKAALAIVDIQGVESIRAMHSGIPSIFIIGPTERKTLEARLRERTFIGIPESDTHARAKAEAIVQNRLIIGDGEIAAFEAAQKRPTPLFDTSLVNDAFAPTYDAFKKFALKALDTLPVNTLAPHPGDVAAPSSKAYTS